MGQPEAEGGGVSHTGMCAVSFTRTDRYCTVPYVHTGSQDIVKYNKITIQYVLSLFIHRDAVVTYRTGMIPTVPVHTLRNVSTTVLIKGVGRSSWWIALWKENGQTDRQTDRQSRHYPCRLGF